jgi:hypothetical protein
MKRRAFRCAWEVNHSPWDESPMYPAPEGHQGGPAPPRLVTDMTATTSWHVLNALGGASLDLPAMRLYFSRFWGWLDSVPGKRHLSLRVDRVTHPPKISLSFPRCACRHHAHIPGPDLRGRRRGYASRQSARAVCRAAQRDPRSLAVHRSPGPAKAERCARHCKGVRAYHGEVKATVRISLYFRWSTWNSRRKRRPLRLPSATFTLNTLGNIYD